MNTFWQRLSAAFLSTLCIASVAAAPGNDYKWMNLNLMYTHKELPRPKVTANNGHNYFELEFGGRSGALDLYGYVDVFNLTNRDDSDKKGQPKAFMKFAPRLSLTGSLDTLGPVSDIYFATLFTWGGGARDTNNSFWGIGSDVQVPWFGKMGLNLYGLYDLNKKGWNGLQVSTNWFTPFYTFANGSFITYQGYIDYQFGAKSTFAGNSQAKSGGTMFNGLYWHYDKLALGYGLKLYSNIYLIKNNSHGLKSSGASNFFAVSYKF